MAGRIEWITFKNKSILYNDRSNLEPDDIISNVNESKKIIIDSGKRQILYLVNNSDSMIVPHVKDHIKKVGQELAPYIAKSAVIGASNAQQILLKILSAVTKMNIQVFNTLEEAKEWLVK